MKRWVTMTLGHDKLHRSWPKAVQDDLDDEVGGSLVRDFPLRQTRDAILKRLPLLAEWGNSRIDWGDLQYVESQVILQTVETLAFSHDVPCLPVHDSIIVPCSTQHQATLTLSETFRSIVGAAPHLKVA